MGAQSASLAYGNGTLFAALGGLCPGFASLHPSRLIRPELDQPRALFARRTHPSTFPHFTPREMCRSSSGTRHPSGVRVCGCCLAGTPGSATGRAYGLRPLRLFLHSSNPSGGPSLTKTEPTSASFAQSSFV
ncbi:hypothetical protein niasHT_009109 [Heterodera trifolii]|uniref:Secreted protein n=1 Tax=Heterodera trifolii TaxID=157864 RepID=A0ABD2M698_9BILA